MTDEQMDYADQLEREDWEDAKAERDGAETERQNELWDAGSEARHQDEMLQMVRDDEAKYADDTTVHLDRHLDRLREMTAEKAEKLDAAQTRTDALYAQVVARLGMKVRILRGALDNLPAPSGAGSQELALLVMAKANLESAIVLLEGVADIAKAS